MVCLQLYFTLREQAHVSRAEIPARTLEELLARATERFGEGFARCLPGTRVWINDDLVVGSARDIALAPSDEVVLLPPVSGG
ncbi:MoaD/ThiS family protein [Gordonia desulfuricans]|uniref:MoaD/ThiS family protein n=1 Tax=Gordonia desulfuricans TaxID=89051 RepID=A0A7K3LIY2_9ACTN|nr:MoaD/ThiS family protein [Gordonia desulfuricans]NDK88158.1 MoaD/ThiS family protein [Gordonia desulfuricans]